MDGYFGNGTHCEDSDECAHDEQGKLLIIWNSPLDVQLNYIKTKTLMNGNLVFKIDKDQHKNNWIEINWSMKNVIG